MPKRAAQECLEIAKILQLQNQKEEANHYLREAQRLNPALSNVRRDASGPGETVATAYARDQAGELEYIALKGDLSEIGMLDVIQVLDNAQKSGKLLITSEGKDGLIFFNSGRIVNAQYENKNGEQAMYSLVGVKGGTFEYKPSDKAFDVVINNSNTNLLLEGLRLLDEANRDLNETGFNLEEDVDGPPEKESNCAGTVNLESAGSPLPVPSPPLHHLHKEENPLEDI
jgi:hypothetical protein